MSHFEICAQHCREMLQEQGLEQYYSEKVCRSIYEVSFFTNAFAFAKMAAEKIIQLAHANLSTTKIY